MQIYANNRISEIKLQEQRFRCLEHILCIAKKAPIHKSDAIPVK